MFFIYVYSILLFLDIFGIFWYDHVEIVFIVHIHILSSQH